MKIDLTDKISAKAEYSSLFFNDSRDIIIETSTSEPNINTEEEYLRFIYGTCISPMLTSYLMIYNKTTGGAKLCCYGGLAEQDMRRHMPIFKDKPILVRELNIMTNARLQFAFLDITFLDFIDIKNKYLTIGRCPDDILSKVGKTMNLGNYSNIQSTGIYPSLDDMNFTKDKWVHPDNYRIIWEDATDQLYSNPFRSGLGNTSQWNSQASAVTSSKDFGFYTTKSDKII